MDQFDIDNNYQLAIIGFAFFCLFVLFFIFTQKINLCCCFCCKNEEY